MELFAVKGGVPAALDPVISSDTTTAGRIVQGVYAAVHGDNEGARQNLQTIRRKPAPARRRSAVEAKLLEAWIAAQANQWEEVIRLLETSTTQGQVPVFSGRVPIRWLVAEAYQRLGRLGEAAQHFELVLSPTSLGNEELLYLRGIPFSFAHQRLVLLYSRMGRLEDARRHWQIFQETFSNPDPELVPMIEEAREAITALEAKV